MNQLFSPRYKGTNKRTLNMLALSLSYYFRFFRMRRTSTEDKISHQDLSKVKDHNFSNDK